jgi:hypothetical protein
MCVAPFSLIVYGCFKRSKCAEHWKPASLKIKLKFGDEALSKFKSLGPDYCRPGKQDFFNESWSQMQKKQTFGDVIGVKKRINCKKVVSRRVRLSRSSFSPIQSGQKQDVPTADAVREARGRIQDKYLGRPAKRLRDERANGRCAVCRLPTRGKARAKNGGERVD